jgi:hypothetical protein
MSGNGTLRAFVCGFSALGAEKPHTNKKKDRSAEGKNADRVISNPT